MKETELINHINSLYPNLLKGIPNQKIDRLISIILRKVGSEFKKNDGDNEVINSFFRENEEHEATKVLENTGVYFLNNNSNTTDERTFIVLGAARGGTSMVAGVLHHLGVVMGEKLSAVYEDLNLSLAVEENRIDDLKSIIQQRNLAHKTWGWKRPSSVKTYDVWHDKFRSPVYIVVFRDLFAIANRNRISMMTDLISDMKNSLNHFDIILNLLERDKKPALLISYEKAMLNPQQFVLQLHKLLDIGNEESVKAAVNFINPNPIAYLKGSRITETKGCVDLITAKEISGWAIYKKVPTRPVKLNITINDQAVYEVTANKMRPDLRDKGLHPTGNCGFSLRFDSKNILKEGDSVSVRAVGDIVDLTNSPGSVKYG